MKQQIVIFFTFMIGLISCGPNEIKPVERSTPESLKEPHENEGESLSPKEEKEITYKLTKEFLSLYKELISFKRKNEFHELGFGNGSPYKIWWEKVDILNAHPNNKVLLKKGAIPGDLQTLATEYLQSKGEETEYSKFMNTELKRVK